MKLAYVALEDINVGERFRKDLGDVEGLANSIEELELATPITLKEDGPDKYTLMAGERRLRAYMKLGKPTIPARIYPKDTDEYTLRAIELAENLERKDMGWIERRKLVAEIHRLWTVKHGGDITRVRDGVAQTAGHTIQDTANMLGLNRGLVNQDLILDKAAEMYPEINQCKTRDDAVKLFKNIRKTTDRKEAAEVITERIAKGGVDSFRSNLVNNYIIADTFETMSKLDIESYDFLEVDPPYGIDLGSQKKLDGGSSLNVNMSAYNEVHQDIYEEFLAKLRDSMYRIMAPHSWAILWYGIEPWHDTVFKVFSERFDVRELPAIWTKPTGQCINPDIHLANSYETFFYMKKGKPHLYREGRSNVFTYRPVTPTDKTHPTEKPIEMLQDIFSVFCWEGTRAFVPFLGSGNSLLALSNMNIVGAGTDLARQYKDAFVEKVMANEPGKYHSYKEEQ